MSGTDTNSYTVRLELVDEPGELLRALEPIADNGGNLLSIFHERGNLTPRGHIPVEVDLEATEARFDAIVDALREAGVNVIQAGAERYSEELTVVLVGHLVETDLSDTLRRFTDCGGVSVADVSLSAPAGTEGGHLTHVPAHQVYDVDITVEEAIQYILTTGLVNTGK